MRSPERGRQHESLENTIARVAYAYGFSTAPAAIPRKAVADSSGTSMKTKAAVALVNAASAGKGPVQSWGTARKNNGTVVSFAIFATRHAIAPAIVVKTALSIAEVAGFTNLAVLVSSVGDLESRKRFTRELGNFFRKRPDDVPEEFKQLASTDPDAAYRAMLEKKEPALSRMPRSIDYLSESSRKTMLATLGLFESVGIAYEIDPRLPAEPGIESELLFAVEGDDRKGNRVRIASGGRYDEAAKRVRGAQAEPAVAISIEIQERLDLESTAPDPTCFIVHVGDGAKLKAFGLLEALWRAHIAVGNALMAENLREQMAKSLEARARYIAIIGQREALDGTAIVRSTASAAQMTLPLDKLAGYVGRARV